MEAHQLTNDPAWREWVNALPPLIYNPLLDGDVGRVSIVAQTGSDQVGLGAGYTDAPMDATRAAQPTDAAGPSAPPTPPTLVPTRKAQNLERPVSHTQQTVASALPRPDVAPRPPRMAPALPSALSTPPVAPPPIAQGGHTTHCEQTPGDSLPPATGRPIRPPMPPPMPATAAPIQPASEKTRMPLMLGSSHYQHRFAPAAETPHAQKSPLPLHSGSSTPRMFASPPPPQVKNVPQLSVQPSRQQPSSSTRQVFAPSPNLSTTAMTTPRVYTPPQVFTPPLPREQGALASSAPGETTRGVAEGYQQSTDPGARGAERTLSEAADAAVGDQRVSLKRKVFEEETSAPGPSKRLAMQSMKQINSIDAVGRPVQANSNLLSSQHAHPQRVAAAVSGPPSDMPESRAANNDDDLFGSDIEDVFNEESSSTGKLYLPLGLPNAEPLPASSSGSWTDGPIAAPKVTAPRDAAISAGVQQFASGVKRSSIPDANRLYLPGTDQPSAGTAAGAERSASRHSLHPEVGSTSGGELRLAGMAARRQETGSFAGAEHPVISTAARAQTQSQRAKKASKADSAPIAIEHAAVDDTQLGQNSGSRRYSWQPGGGLSGPRVLLTQDSQAPSRAAPAAPPPQRHTAPAPGGFVSAASGSAPAPAIQRPPPDLGPAHLRTQSIQRKIYWTTGPAPTDKSFWCNTCWQAGKPKVQWFNARGHREHVHSKHPDEL